MNPITTFFALILVFGIIYINSERRNDVVTSFDKYIQDHFEKSCPDAARFQNSWNPIATKKVEEARFFFTIGMLTRNSFDEDEVINWDIAISEMLCPNCELYDPDESCDEDPAECESCKKLEHEYLSSLNYTEKR